MTVKVGLAEIDTQREGKSWAMFVIFDERTGLFCDTAREVALFLRMLFCGARTLCWRFRQNRARCRSDEPPRVDDVDWLFRRLCPIDAFAFRLRRPLWFQPP